MNLFSFYFRSENIIFDKPTKFVAKKLHTVAICKFTSHKIFIRLCNCKGDFDGPHTRFSNLNHCCVYRIIIIWSESKKTGTTVSELFWPPLESMKTLIQDFSNTDSIRICRIMTKFSGGVAWKTESTTLFLDLKWNRNRFKTRLRVLTMKGQKYVCLVWP